MLQALVLVLGTMGPEVLRLQSVASYLQRESTKNRKYVVFASSPGVADRIAAELPDLVNMKVVRHRESDGEDWRRFQTESSERVLVCDREAEEGLNLQVRDAEMVHFDLPLDARRVEQRLGRLDRYGSGRSVRSVVLLPRSAAISEGVYRYFNEALQVFDRSVASLQYVLRKSHASLEAGMLHDGVDCIRSQSDMLGGDDGLLATELRRIQAQDDLDALEWDADDETAITERVWQVDSDTRSLETAYHYWLDRTLRLKTRPISDTRKSFRLQLTPATTLPVNDFIDRFLDVMDPDSPGFVFTRPWTPELTVYRRSAVRNALRVLRIGNPLIDALAEYARWDDMGCAFSLWREWPGLELHEDPLPVFRFDFLVELDTSAALQALHAGTVPVDMSDRALRRLADGLFPPRYASVFLQPGGDPVPLSLLPACQAPYRRRYDSYRDTPITSMEWTILGCLVSSSDWRNLCRHVRADAEAQLQEALDLRTYVLDKHGLAKRYAAARRAQALNRLAFLDPQMREAEAPRLEQDSDVMEALLAGLAEPSLTLDSVGAIWLSNEALAAVS